MWNGAKTLEREMVMDCKGGNNRVTLNVSNRIRSGKHCTSGRDARFECVVEKDTVTHISTYRTLMEHYEDKSSNDKLFTCFYLKCHAG